MKNPIIMCLFFALTAKSQTKGSLDTVTTIGGVKLDKNIASYRNNNDFQATDPKECDTCVRYANKDAVYQLKKHSLMQEGFWLKQQPYVRAYEYFIYEITQVYERMGSDSSKYVAYKSAYGNPAYGDTIINGKQLRLFTWESISKRLLYIPDAEKFTVVLTDKFVESSLRKTYKEKNVFNKRDADARELLTKLPVTGTGKSTFVLSLSHLESVLAICNITSLQNQFSDWYIITDPFKTNVGWPYNEKTKQRDIPEFKINYMTKVKGKSLLVWAKTPKSLTEKIYEIEISCQIDGMKYAEIKQSVKNAGYLLNEQLTQFFHKETWQHKTKPYTVKLNYNNGIAFIGLSDSKRYQTYFSK